MAKSMRMDPLSHLNKIMARQPTEKLTLIRNSFVSKNISSYKWLKKQRRNSSWIIKEANCMSRRGKIMAERANQSLIFSRKTTRKKAHPAIDSLLYLLGPLFDCVTIQGLTFQSFVGVIVMLVAAVLFSALFQAIKRWKWLIMNKLKAKLKRLRDKHEEINEDRDETRSSVDVGGGKKWTWIDLVPDFSGIDDIFINLYIVVGLGFLCGILVLVRRLFSKNVENSTSEIL